MANHEPSMLLGPGHSSDAPYFPPGIEPQGTLNPAIDASSLEALRKELDEDVGKSLDKNMVVFSRKLDVQKHVLVTELTNVVKSEGNRVVAAVVSGPHDRITDIVSLMYG